MVKRWSEISKDPNSGAVLAARAEKLVPMYRPEARSRFELIVEHCRGRKVVDIGCVDHEITSVDDPSWLHGAVRRAAAECVGLDYDEEGIAQMQAAGLDAVHGDMVSGIDALRDRAPFDVVVGGEIIEHVPNPQSVLEFASAVLRPGGTLLLTTPNPYAPGRVRGGRLGLAFENVDHVVYIFPAGLVEMADRTGMVVRTISTIGYGHPVSTVRKSWRAYARAVKRRLRGARPDYSSKLQPYGRARLSLPPNYITPLESVRLLLSPRMRARGMLGETAIYVLEKPTVPEPG